MPPNNYREAIRRNQRKSSPRPTPKSGFSERYKEFLQRKKSNAAAAARYQGQASGTAPVKSKTTVKRGDDVHSVAERLGVTPKAITDRGIRKIAPGQVISVNTQRRQAEEQLARMGQDRVDEARLVQEEAQKILDSGISGPRAPGQRLDAQRRIAEAQKIIDGELSGEQPYQQPRLEPSGRVTEPVETPISQFIRAIQRGRQQLGIQGVEEPAPQFMAGTSPGEIQQQDELIRFQNITQLQQARFPGATNVPSQAQQTPGAFRDMIERGNFDDAFAAQMGGNWVTDAKGKRVFVSNVGASQRSLDVRAATLNSEAIDYAIKTEDWSLLPTFISAGSAQHMGILSPEEMSMLGYSQDQYGNWVHEVPDTDVPYNPGYGDYRGGYGGYGGYGSGGGFTPNKNTYAGGRAEQLSGQFMRGNAERAQAGGLGGSLWRI